MTITLLQADARQIPLPDQSVHCVVTSPPYWGLRDYGVDGQLGLEPSPDEYVANMVAVFSEVWRILRDDGTLWLNLGDSYGTGTTAARTQGSRGLSAKTQHAQDAVGRCGGMAKQLIGIPWRVAFALQSNGADMRAVRQIERVRNALLVAYEGESLPDRVLATLERLEREYSEAKGCSWYLRSDVIWHKPNPMPESVTDRPTKAHDYVFLLAKKPRYYYDADAVREPLQEPPHAPGNKPKFGDVLRNDFGTDRMTAVWGNPAGRNRRTVWTIATAPYSGAHFATYPPALVVPCIMAGTSSKGVCPVCGAQWERVTEKDTEYLPGYGNMGIKGSKWVDEDKQSSGHRIQKNMNALRAAGRDHDNPFPRKNTTGWRATCAHDADPIPATVLDPFIGSGTTALVARELGRDAIGADISDEYLKLAQKRLGMAHSTWQSEVAQTGSLFDGIAEMGE